MVSMKRALTILALLFPAVAHADAPSDVQRKPHLSTSASILDFAEAGTQEFTVSKDGNAVLELRRVQPAEGSYGFTLMRAPTATLQPGQSLKVQVQYIPDGKRKQAFGGIQIYSNDDRFPSTPQETSSYVAGVQVRAGNSWLLTAMVFLPLLG